MLPGIWKGQRGMVQVVVAESGQIAKKQTENRVVCRLTLGRENPSCLDLAAQYESQGHFEHAMRNQCLFLQRVVVKGFIANLTGSQNSF